MNQTLTTKSDEVPLIYFARALWEAGQPLSMLSRAVLGIGDRALKKRLSSGIDGTVPKEVVNMVTSYNEEFAVPLAQDHPPVVVLARMAIRATTASASGIKLVLEMLTWELVTAKANSDLRLQGLLHWLMVSASIRAASLTDDRNEVRKHHEEAAHHAIAMNAFVKTAQWADPSLMRAIERRNWASTDYLLRTLDGGTLDDGLLLSYINAYDEGIEALNAAHMGVQERPGFNPEPERLAKRRPMLRAFVLDRLDMSGQFEGEGKRGLINVHIQALVREFESTSSPNILWMALLGLEDKTKRNLQAYASWILFQKKLKQAVNKRRDGSQEAKK